MKENTIVEWAQFELAEGVTEDALLRASRALQEGFLEKQRGFVRRELLRGKGRTWVDLVYWTDRASAEEVMQAAMKSHACLEYFKLMTGLDEADPAGGVLHFERVAAYPGPPEES